MIQIYVVSDPNVSCRWSIYRAVPNSILPAQKQVIEIYVVGDPNLYVVKVIDIEHRYLDKNPSCCCHKIASAYWINHHWLMHLMIIPQVFHKHQSMIIKPFIDILSKEKQRSIINDHWSYNSYINRQNNKSNNDSIDTSIIWRLSDE